MKGPIITRVVQFKCASESPGGLVKTHFPRPYTPKYDAVDQAPSPSVCICNTLQADAHVARPRPARTEPWITCLRGQPRCPFGRQQMPQERRQIVLNHRGLYEGKPSCLVMMREPVANVEAIGLF